MLYREMPKNSDKLSILGFGCMRFEGGNLTPNEDKAITQIRASIAKGVNYFDTAWPYHGGKSEGILCKALKDGYREKVKIADKLPQWLLKSREDMDYYLNEQLKRLEVDYIDYYLIHGLDGKTWKKNLDLGIIDFMDKAKASGKIKNAGFSFHGDRDDFPIIIDSYDWDFCQIQYNILDEHIQAGIEGLEYAYSKGIGVIVMEPLRGGLLADKLPSKIEKLYNKFPKERTNAEWALRWVWNHPGVTCVLSGMSNMRQVEENIKIASDAEPNSLTEEEINITKEVSKIFSGLMKVPCTACQYCMPCPQGINIPHSFTLYNVKHLFNKGLKNRIQYLKLHGGVMDKKPELASQCINCGKCVKHCPQHIDIPAELKNVSKTYEGIIGKPLTFIIDKAMRIGSSKEKK